MTEEEIPACELGRNTTGHRPIAQIVDGPIAEAPEFPIPEWTPEQMSPQHVQARLKFLGRTKTGPRLLQELDRIVTYLNETMGLMAEVLKEIDVALKDLTLSPATLQTLNDGGLATLLEAAEYFETHEWWELEGFTAEARDELVNVLRSMVKRIDTDKP